MKLWNIWLMAVLTLYTGSTFAIFKCTTPSGHITFQDFPCGEATDPQRMGIAAPAMGTYVAPNPIKKAPAQALPMLMIYRRWIDAEQLAIAADRSALVGPIASMQTIRRDVEMLQVPECLEKSRAALLALVSNTTKNMLEFMSRTGADDLKFFLIERIPLINQFERALRFAPCPGYNAG
ncbi:MAG: hypothetical protein Q7J58_05935 [Hydrogenophaga sp.]|uniref:hypothetical protein n=1 Tax=Hydrogenophaga sp. TaxID=1904254 RepID=UPI002722D120|nr:hypothetical protein [Hydrogenophaga sp.]MDO9568907.1 hypothetical protein [Hydrogenophaga sp.]